MTRDDFISTWAPEAARIAPQLGVDPTAILGHWGQETGWGSSLHDYNVGNITAGSGWGGKKTTRGDATASGQPYQTAFRAYESPSQAADDYASLLQSPRYQGALNTGSDALKFGQGLKAGGYMANPNGPQDIAASAASISGMGTGADYGAGTANATPAPFQPANRPPVDLPAAPQARGPSEVAQIAPKGPGDDMISVGLAMMGGAPDRDGFKDAAKAYQAIQSQDQARAVRQAEFKNDGINRDWSEPYKAYDAAMARSRLGVEMRGQDTSADTARMNNDSLNRYRAEEIATRRAEMGERRYQFDNAQKGFTDYVLPGEQAGQEQIFRVEVGRDGSKTVNNMNTGQPVDALPAGVVPWQTYNARESQGARQQAKGEQVAGDFLKGDSEAHDKLNQIDQAIKAANDPNAHSGSDLGSKVARAVLPLFGLAGDQQYANMTLAQVAQTVTSQAAKGQGAVSDYERRIFAQLAPSLDTDPAARNKALQLMRDVAERQIKVRDAWTSMTPAERRATSASPLSFQEWQMKTTRGIMSEQDERRQKADDASKPPPGPAGSQPAAAGSFWKTPDPSAQAAPQGPPALVAPAPPGPGMIDPSRPQGGAILAPAQPNNAPPSRLSYPGWRTED